MFAYIGYPGAKEQSTAMNEITTTISESITSIRPQLARELALSSFTVVAYVRPFSWLSEGFSVSKLTMTIRAMLNRKSRMQKYRKLSVAKA